MALRILHTADWHLGQSFYEYDRMPEQERFLNWLRDTLVEKEAGVLIISGDIFDVSNPPAAAQRLFYTFLREVTTLLPGLQVVCIAGNHDSAARLESPRSLLEVFNVRVTGTVGRDAGGRPDYGALRIPLKGRTGTTEAWCLAVPFLRPGDFPAGSGTGEGSYAAGMTAFYREAVTEALGHCESGQALVVTGHLHTAGALTTGEDKCERPILGGLEFVPAGAFGTEAAYVALGHIHRPQTVDGLRHIRYAGSPLPMSFSEEHYPHQVVCVDLENGLLKDLEALPVPVTVPLLSVPPRPQPLLQVLEELEKLPPASTQRHSAPYLRVRVLLDGPEPSLRIQVEKALENKEVRLAKIEVSYPGRDQEEQQEGEGVSRLDTLRPLDLFRRRYQALYNREIPQELVELFHIAVTETESGDLAPRLQE